jgi:aminoglycoside phosphotransferase (APT) family kinase protein
MGRPAGWFPFPWAIYTWIEGRPYADELIDDERQAAKDIARFVLELRGIPVPDGAPSAGRKSLADLDAVTREALASAGEAIDGRAAAAVWERALGGSAWHGAPVWIHADLLRPNLLVAGGRLSAVIDFGSVGVGDPRPTSFRPGACSARPDAKRSGMYWAPTTTRGVGHAATRSTRPR